MFHVNDAYDDKGTLTVKRRKDDHSYQSCIKKYCKSVSWYNKKMPRKKGAKLLQPTTDTITDENGNVVTDIEGSRKKSTVLMFRFRR